MTSSPACCRWSPSPCRSSASPGPPSAAPGDRWWRPSPPSSSPRDDGPAHRLARPCGPSTGVGRNGQRLLARRSGLPVGGLHAALSAVVTAVSPLLHRRWRRALWFLVGFAAFLRMTTAAAVPVNVAIAVLLGVVAGSAVLLALGVRPGASTPRPSARPWAGPACPWTTWRRSRPRAARCSSADVRTGGRSMSASLAATSATPTCCIVAGGGCGSRGSRTRWPRSDRAPRCATRHWPPTWPPGRGPRCPASFAVGETPDDDGLLALDLVEGVPLVGLPPEAVTDDLLRRVWGEVSRLHQGRVAHRRLSTDQVLVGRRPGADADRVAVVPARGHRRSAGGRRGRSPGGDRRPGGRGAGRGRGRRGGPRGPVGRGPAARPTPRPLGRDPTSGP